MGEAPADQPSADNGSDQAVKKRTDRDVKNLDPGNVDPMEPRLGYAHGKVGKEYDRQGTNHINYPHSGRYRSGSRFWVMFHQ